MNPEANVSTAARPSDLRITDLRVARLRGAPFHSTLIRIDTDQGISGYGEVRDGGSPTYALMLKSRLLGQNPCDVDRLFRRIKQFGHHARQAGGVCAVEMALMDLAGRGWTSAWASCGGGRTASSRRRACWSRPPSCTPSPGSGSRRLLLRVLNGLATRNYEACAETVPQAFGLSRSSVPNSRAIPGHLRGHLEQLTHNVRRWTNSSQRHRWVATALLDIEPRLRRVNGYHHLPMLRQALQAEFGINQLAMTG